MATILDLTDPFAIARSFAPTEGRHRLGHPMADKLARIPPDMLPQPPRHILMLPPEHLEWLLPELRIPWIAEALALPPEELGRLIWVLLLARREDDDGVSPTPNVSLPTILRVTDWLVEFDRRERRARLADDDLRNILIRDADRLINTRFVEQPAILWLNLVLPRMAPDEVSAATRQAFRAMLNGRNGNSEVVDEAKTFGLVGLCRLAGIAEEETRVFRETRLAFLGGLAREARMISELHPVHHRLLAGAYRRHHQPPPVRPADLQHTTEEDRGQMMLDRLRARDLLRHRYWADLRSLNTGYSRAQLLLNAYRGAFPAPDWLVARWRDRYDPGDNDGIGFAQSGQAARPVSTYALLLDLGFCFRDDQIEEVVDISIREAREARETRTTGQPASSDIADIDHIARALRPGQIGFFVDRRGEFDDEVFERILCCAGVPRAEATLPLRRRREGASEARSRLRAGFRHLRRILRR